MQKLLRQSPSPAILCSAVVNNTPILPSFSLPFTTTTTTAAASFLSLGFKKKTRPFLAPASATATPNALLRHYLSRPPIFPRCRLFLNPYYFSNFAHQLLPNMPLQIDGTESPRVGLCKRRRKPRGFTLFPTRVCGALLLLLLPLLLPRPRVWKRSLREGFGCWRRDGRKSRFVDDYGCGTQELE